MSGAHLEESCILEDPFSNLGRVIVQSWSSATFSFRFYMWATEWSRNISK